MLGPSSRSNQVTRKPISIFDETKSNQNELKNRLKELRNQYRGYFLGIAVSDEDAFFDSFVQGLKELDDTKNCNVKSLRRICSKYVKDAYSDKSQNLQNLKLNIPKTHGISIESYIEAVNHIIKTTPDNKEKVPQVIDPTSSSKESSHLIFGGSEVEGKILSDVYNVQIIIIELNSKKGNGLSTTKVGKGDNIVYIVKYSGHFVPLLKGIKKDITKEKKFAEKELYGEIEFGVQRSENRPMDIDNHGQGISEGTTYASDGEKVTSRSHTSNMKIKKFMKRVLAKGSLFIKGSLYIFRYKLNTNGATNRSQQPEIREKRGISQKEMKVDQLCADFSNVEVQEKMRSDENDLQPSKKIKITNNPSYKGESSRSLIGSIYQVKLLMLFLRCAAAEGNSFYLGTEMQAAEKFDDLVLQCNKDDKSVCYFLQAKYHESRKKICVNDLMDEKRTHGSFYLKKYFASCRKIKSKGLPDLLDSSKEKEFVIFTNINLHQNLQNSFQKLTDKDFILDKVAKNESQRFKFKLDNFSKKEDLVYTLKSVSESPDDLVTDQEIEDFFKHLVFAVNQHNEKELDEIIERELGKEFNLADAGFIFSDFLKKMINWAKKKEKYFLSKKSVEELFQTIKQQFATLVAIGPTALNRTKMKDLGLVYKPEAIEDLRNFLTNKTYKVLNLVTKEIYLSAAKVNQVLDNNNYNKEDSCIFTSLEDLLTLKHLVEAFELEQKDRLLVVMCKPVKEDVEELFRKLYAKIQGNSKKQIVFITEQDKDNSSHSKIIEDKFNWTERGSGGNHYKKIEDKNNSFEYLNSESQRNLQEKQVTFQGQTTNLSLLATPEFLNQFIVGKVLIDLVEGKEIKIGSEISVFDHIDIDRTFYSQVIIKENALTDQDNSDIFAISKAKPRYLNKFSDNNKVKVLDENNSEDHFKRICEENKEHNVHWLSREKDAKGKLVLAYKKSRGSLCDLRGYIYLDDKNYEKEDKFIQRRLAIISGEPGIGKSSTMERLFRRIRESNPSLWVVKINLVNCRSQLSKVNFDHSNLEELADFLSENAQLNTKLEKELFKYKLQQQNEIALLFDGFDEIGSAYEKEILPLLKILKDLPSMGKMYISTRPYMKGRLEDSLGVFSCELSPLELQDQKKFLQYLFKKEISENSNVNEERISTFVDELLKSCSKIMNGAFSLDNPLCLKMLARFFEKEFQEFYGNKNKYSIEFDNFNCLDLYECYIACKICVYTERVGFKLGTDNLRTILDKKNLIRGKKPIGNSLESREKREAISLLTEYKKKFAALFLKELFDDKEYLAQLDLGQEYQTDLCEIGVLHSSIYEYHVARFFVNECLRDTNNRDPRIFRLLEKYYFHLDGKGMKYFFDLIVSKDCPLHVNVINGNFDEVKRLIESEDEGERKKLLGIDGQDRSILHFINDSTVKEFTSLLRQENKKTKYDKLDHGIFYNAASNRDKIFNWTPLQYTARGGQWKIVDKILSLRAWKVKKKLSYDCYVDIDKELINRDKGLIDDILKAVHGISFTSYCSLLHMAVREKLLYLSLGLIEHVELHELTKEDSDGRQPLYYIFCKNTGFNVPYMLTLILDKIDLNKCDSQGQMAAHFFVMMLNDKETSNLNNNAALKKIVCLFIDKKVDMNINDSDGNAPIHIAAMRNRWGVLKFLIDQYELNIDIDAPDSNKKTLLHHAVSSGNLDAVKYLVREGAYLSAIDKNNNAPLQYATDKYLDVKEFLEKELAGLHILPNSMLKIQLPQQNELSSLQTLNKTIQQKKQKPAYIKLDTKKLENEVEEIERQMTEKCKKSLRALQQQMQILQSKTSHQHITKLECTTTLEQLEKLERSPLELIFCITEEIKQLKAKCRRAIRLLEHQDESLNASSSNTVFSEQCITSSVSDEYSQRQHLRDPQFQYPASHQYSQHFSTSHTQQYNCEHASNFASADSFFYIRNQDPQQQHTYFDPQNPSNFSQPGVFSSFQATFLPNQCPQYFSQYTPPTAFLSTNLDSKEERMGSGSQDKSSKKRKISLQQSNSSSHKRKAEEIDSSQQKGNSSRRHKGLTEIHSVLSDEERQEVFTRISEFISNNFPNASIKSVRQGLHLPSFEKRGVKVNGKCVAITRSFSQALFLHSEESILSNLETLAEIYEYGGNKQILSKRGKREVHDLEDLIYSFEEQLDSYTNSSLPLSLIHNTKEDRKTFSDLSSYIAEIEGDFAIHLVTSNHVVAIYRIGDNYAHLDSNIAFVSGLKSVDQLIEVLNQAVKFAAYKVEEKGFLVEHFDVARANNQLPDEDKQVLTKEIKTEHQLLAEQDKEFGLIKINGQEVSRVQLYNFGTKINVEGSVPLLINADMNLDSKSFSDYLSAEKISMTAREYLENLKNSKNVEEVVQATKVIPFMGSKREIEEAEQTREPKRSLLEQLVKGAVNFIASNLTTAFFASVSRSESQLSEATNKIDNNPKSCLSDTTIDDQLKKSVS